MPDEEERMWAMFCHLASLAAFVLPALGHIIGPLVVYLLKKDEYPLVADQGKESLNFQLSCTLYVLALSFLICLFWPLLLIIPVLQLIFVVIASMEANKGVAYRYPLTIRFLT